MNKLNRKELKLGIAQAIDYLENISLFDELNPEEKNHLAELNRIYDELSGEENKNESCEKEKSNSI